VLVIVRTVASAIHKSRAVCNRLPTALRVCRRYSVRRRRATPSRTCAVPALVLTSRAVSARPTARHAWHLNLVRVVSIPTRTRSDIVMALTCLAPRCWPSVRRASTTTVTRHRLCVRVERAIVSVMAIVTARQAISAYLAVLCSLTVLIRVVVSSCCRLCRLRRRRIASGKATAICATLSA
jgi:hypothetical protein